MLNERGVWGGSKLEINKCLRQHTLTDTQGHVMRLARTKDMAATISTFANLTHHSRIDKGCTSDSPLNKSCGWGVRPHDWIPGPLI